MQEEQLQVHGSCVSREGVGVLLIGPSGAGKSDLALRLLFHGFTLVADDRVDLRDGVATAPQSLAGLLEIRGLGIVRLPHTPSARIALVVELMPELEERLPVPIRHAALDVPLIRLSAVAPSAPERVVLALGCALGRYSQVAGVFAA